MKSGDVLKNCFSHIFEPLLDFVFPNYCILCETRLQQGEAIVCLNCWLRQPVLTQASTKLDNRSSVAVDTWYVEESFAVWQFQGEMQRIIHAFKYAQWHGLSSIMGLAMGGAVLNSPLLSTADLILPVPLHKVRYRERGYNQSSLLACCAARICNISVNEKILTRTRHTSIQARLSSKERLKNVLNAFSVKTPEDVRNKKIILVDDVLTTGVTINECARVLIESGASHVYALTAARVY